MSEALALHRETERVLVRAMDEFVLGFAEAGAAAALAAKVRSGRGLTADEARQAWRILHRNPAGLAKIGESLPGMVPPSPRGGGHDTLHPAPAPQVALRPDGRIGISEVYEIKEKLKARLRPAWDGKARQWHLPSSPAYAAELLEILAPYAPAVSPRVRDLAGEHPRRAAARSVLDPSSPVPELDLAGILRPGARLWEHQSRAIEYLRNATAALLAVPMGGGKSMSAIAAANALDVKRAVILAPNKARGVWPREVSKWSAKSWHMVDGKRPAKRRGAPPQDLRVIERVAQAEECLFDCTCGADTHAAVFNYEMLAHDFLAGEGADGHWKPAFPLDLVIFDEIHRLKSGTGLISKTAAKWVDFSRIRWGLTGTPMPQRPTDAFGSMRALEPGIFGTTWTPFKSRYALERETRDGRKFIVGIQPERKDEFAEKVHSIMYRPTVDLELPGRQHVVREVELEPKARKAYQDLDEEMFADLEAFAAGEGDGSTLTPKNVLSRTMRLAQLTGGTVPDDEWVATGGKDGSLVRISTAKADALAEILDESGCVAGRDGGAEPVIVYCQFRADLDAVRMVAEKAGLAYAEVSGRRSDGLTSTSEMTPDADVVGVQIQSGGTGVDLTRARYGVWYSTGYSLSDFDQASKRQDRPGQTRPVVFTYLVCPDTVDIDIYQALHDRRSVVNSILQRRGVDPDQLGLELPMPEPVEQEHGTRTGGAVSLPMDDWESGTMAPRAARRGPVPKDPAEDMDPAELAALGLDF